MHGHTKIKDKNQVLLNLTRTTGTLQEALRTFMIIYRRIIKTRNASDKSCRETRNTHFVSNSFLSEVHDVRELMWKKGRAGQAIDHNIIRRRKDALCMQDI